MPTPPLLVALALLAGEPANDEELAAAYEVGQELLELKEYAKAAKAFERILDMAPESKENRAVRESVALNVVESYFGAYSAFVDEMGQHELRHLEDAAAFRERYLAGLESAYGSRDVAYEPVQAAFERLDQLLEEHHAQKVEPCLSPIEPPIEPCLQPLPCLEPIEPKRGCGGTNDPLVAAALLLPLGLRRREVFERIADTLPADVAARLKSKLDDES